MTGTADWRARKRDQTHQRIYDTAMRLFQERGFDHVSVSDIATVAKVSVPTFYAHYENKEHIVMQMPTQEQIDRLYAALPADLPLAERVRTGILLWIDHYGPAELDVLLERWRIVVTTPGLRNRAAEFERVTAGLIADAFKTGSADSSPITTEVVVTASLSAYTQILLRWAEDDGRRPLRAVAEDVLAALHDL